MDDQTQQGAAASVDQAAAAASDGNPNAGKPAVAPAAAAVEAKPAEHAPTVEEMAAKRNAENLAKAEAHGYKAEPEPTREERAKTLIADMEHAVANNGPISMAMMNEVRALLMPEA